MKELEKNIKSFQKTLNDLTASFNELTEQFNKAVAEEKENDNSSDNILKEYIAQINNATIQDPSYVVAYDGTMCANREKFDKVYFNPYYQYPLGSYANQSAKIKKFNDMLLAFKWCYDTCYVANWDNQESTKYFITYDYLYNTYEVQEFCFTSWNMVAFGTLEVAQKCVDWLNDIDPKGDLVKV